MPLFMAFSSFSQAISPPQPGKMFMHTPAKIWLPLRRCCYHQGSGKHTCMPELPHHRSSAYGPGFLSLIWCWYNGIQFTLIPHFNSLIFWLSPWMSHRLTVVLHAAQQQYVKGMLFLSLVSDMYQLYKVRREFYPAWGRRRLHWMRIQCFLRQVVVLQRLSRNGRCSCMDEAMISTAWLNHTVASFPQSKLIMLWREFSLQWYRLKRILPQLFVLTPLIRDRLEWVFIYAWVPCRILNEETISLQICFTLTPPAIQVHETGSRRQAYIYAISFEAPHDGKMLLWLAPHIYPCFCSVSHKLSTLTIMVCHYSTLVEKAVL